MISHTVQVTSFGGSGTTALARHLEEEGCSLPQGESDWGEFKHQRRPPSPGDVPSGFRVVYLFSDPADAAVSVFARNFQHEHYRRMHGLPRNWSGPYPEALATLRKFAYSGFDLFDIAEHLSNWLRVEGGYPVLFVRQAALGDSWNLIRSFVGLPSTAATFVGRSRVNLRQEQAPDVAWRLADIFDEASQIVDALPTSFLRGS